MRGWRDAGPLAGPLAAAEESAERSSSADEAASGGAGAGAGAGNARRAGDGVWLVGAGTAAAAYIILNYKFALLSLCKLACFHNVYLL